jgi:hypothetical protein
VHQLNRELTAMLDAEVAARRQMTLRDRWCCWVDRLSGGLVVLYNWSLQCALLFTHLCQTRWPAGLRPLPVPANIVVGLPF